MSEETFEGNRIQTIGNEIGNKDIIKMYSQKTLIGSEKTVDFFTSIEWVILKYSLKSSGIIA